jgi:hypothetical protein
MFNLPGIILCRNLTATSLPFNPQIPKHLERGKKIQSELLRHAAAFLRQLPEMLRRTPELLRQLPE